MLSDKIGVFVNCQHGDLCLATCALKYKDQLWPGKKVVWFCNLTPEKATYLDILKFNDAIFEIRPWPEVDFRTLMDSNGQLILNKRADFDSMKDLHNGYFPAPWAMLPNNALNAVNYSNIPRMVFGVDPSLEWHPYLGFSEEEREAARDFCASLPYQKTILFETQLRSAGNFNLAEDTIKSLMQICRNKFGKCNFIFASTMDHTPFIDDVGVVSATQFTVRQVALVHDFCDLMIGVCSGITQACSSWGRKPVPRVELCGSMIVSSVIANGPVTSVICDNFSLAQMKSGLEQAVTLTVNKM